jgi:hypothetical protein
MSVRITASLFGAALALAATMAAADDLASARQVLPGCKDAIAHRVPIGELQAFCIGMVRGIGFMGSLAKLHHNELKSLLNEPSISMDILRKDLCLDSPDEVTTGQQIGVVVAYIGARPARMHERFDALALEALRAAWPCK